MRSHHHIASYYQISRSSPARKRAEHKSGAIIFQQLATVACKAREESEEKGNLRLLRAKLIAIENLVVSFVSLARLISLSRFYLRLPGDCRQISSDTQIRAYKFYFS